MLMMDGMKVVQLEILISRQKILMSQQKILMSHQKQMLMTIQKMINQALWEVLQLVG